MLLSHIFSESSSVVSFCIDHHLFHKETSVLISEGRTKVQIDMNLESSLILCPFSRTILSNACDLSCHTFLSLIMVPGTGFILWSESNTNGMPFMPFYG